MLARYSPPDAQADLPVSWGDETVLRARLGPLCQDLASNGASFVSARHRPVIGWSS